MQLLYTSITSQASSLSLWHYCSSIQESYKGCRALDPLSSAHCPWRREATLANPSAWASGLVISFRLAALGHLRCRSAPSCSAVSVSTRHSSASLNLALVYWWAFNSSNLHIAPTRCANRERLFATARLSVSPLWTQPVLAPSPRRDTGIPPESRPQTLHSC